MSFDFFKQILKAPRQMGSLVPSSRFLAREMVRLAVENAPADALFVELGPGTGVITEVLVREKSSSQEIIAIERNPDFAKKLQARFPTVRVIESSASEIETLLADHRSRPLLILSSIPWLVLPDPVRKSCLIALERVVSANPASRILQYTYSPVQPIHFERLLGVRASFVFMNVPPAWIWSFRSTS